MIPSSTSTHFPPGTGKEDLWPVAGWSVQQSALCTVSMPPSLALVIFLSETFVFVLLLMLMLLLAVLLHTPVRQARQSADTDKLFCFVQISRQNSCGYGVHHFTASHHFNVMCEPKTLTSLSWGCGGLRAALICSHSFFPEISSLADYAYTVETVIMPP